MSEQDRSTAVPPYAVPSFAELPQIPGTPERHAWDVWGRDDELGSLNRIGPAQVRHATGLVRTGQVVSLNLPLDEPRPGLFPDRAAFSHVVSRARTGRDDRVDGLYLQGSSQWDGLRHIRFRQHGYWGGRQEEDLDETGALGIDRWARHGILGRGVLVDVAGHLAARGGAPAPDERLAITGDLIDEVLAAQGVALRDGDVLVLRTGWVEWFRALPDAERARLVGTVGAGQDPLACHGLHAGAETAEYLWDHGVAAVAADNPALEALPVHRDVGFLHHRIIPLLGIAVGEFWLLDALAAACAEAGRHEFLLTSGVLPLPNGVGSPSNAYAVL